MFGFSSGQALGWEGTDFIGYQPNVYTAFRQVIEDFTFPGSLLFLFGVGTFTGLAYHKISLGRSRWVPPLALFYAVVLGSYLANWLNYSSLVCAWLMFAGLSYILPLRCVRLAGKYSGACQRRART